MSQTPHIQCPIHEIPLPALETFTPLVERLQSGDPVVADEVFEKGTLRADGRLDLCKQDAGVVGTEAVTRALQGSSLVQSLLLGTNGIGDEGAAHVAALIQQRPLRTVYLGCNLIGTSGTKALADALRFQPSVRALWLKRNPLGAEGASILAGLLRETSGLRTLDVVHTGIGDGGARELLQALAHHNQSLQYLYLSGNALTPTILPELTAVLARKDGLKGLYLSVNHLGDAGAKGVADALDVQHIAGISGAGELRDRRRWFGGPDGGGGQASPPRFTGPERRAERQSTGRSAKCRWTSGARGRFRIAATGTSTP